MNYKMEIFASEYLILGNATEAALKAGYSPKTAYSHGQRLLKNVEIMEKIQEGQQRVKDNAEVKLTEIVNQIKSIAYSGKTEAIRLKALDMLMKHLGGYADNFKLLSMMDHDKLEELARKALDWN